MSGANDEDNGMSRPHWKNDLNWNTVLSVVMLIGVVAGLGGTYAVLQNQQSINKDNIVHIQAQADAIAQANVIQDGRITTLEVKRANDAAKVEDFKADVLNRVDKLTDKVGILSDSVSALTATIRQSERDTRHRMPQ